MLSFYKCNGNVTVTLVRTKEMAGIERIYVQGLSENKQNINWTKEYNEGGKMCKIREN